MTSPSIFVAIALLALLVGAALPVFYQLYRTLRQARTLLETAGPRLERTLDQVGQAADRLDRIGSTFEAPAQAIGPLLKVASNVGLSIGRSGLGLGLVPGVIAAVRAFFSPADERGGSADRKGRVHGIEETTRD
jgi:hypothetical protein